MSCHRFTDLSFAWPDGQIVFDSAHRRHRHRAHRPDRRQRHRQVHAAAPDRRRPHAHGGGTVRVDGDVGHLRQDLTLSAQLRVDEVLGVAPWRTAPCARWRAASPTTRPSPRSAPCRHGLGRHRARPRDARPARPRPPRPRPAGGHGVRRRGGAARARRAVPAPAAVLLLDEPTNNLDRGARERLYDAVDAWPGVLVVVSHDRELLDRVDRIGELRDGADPLVRRQPVRLRGGGGGRAGGGATARARTPEPTCGARSANWSTRGSSSRGGTATRRRCGTPSASPSASWATGAAPRRCRPASTARCTPSKLAEAREPARRRRGGGARRPVRPHRPAGHDGAGRPEGAGAARGPAALRGDPVDLDVRGPERIALVGPNGAGKTTLLPTIVGDVAASAGTVAVHVPVGYLPQRLDVLDDDAVGGRQRRAVRSARVP